MKQLLLPYELALLAKEKSFDEECIYHYKKKSDTDSHSSIPTFEMKTPFGANHNSLVTRVSAPLYQQIIDWFREKHGLEIQSVLNAETGKRFPFILNTKTGGFDYEANNNWLLHDKLFDTYYEALDKAIEEAFKLI